MQQVLHNERGKAYNPAPPTLSPSMGQGSAKRLPWPSLAPRATSQSANSLRHVCAQRVEWKGRQRACLQALR